MAHADPHSFLTHDSRLAAYGVVVDTEDRVLLALGNDPPEPRWALPGGGVELHESLEDGLVRELEEETGYAVRPVRLLGVATHETPPERRLSETTRWLRSVRVFYEVEIVGGELRDEVDGSTDEARWFPLVEVAGLNRISMVDDGLALLRQA